METIRRGETRRRQRRSRPRCDSDVLGMPLEFAYEFCFVPSTKDQLRLAINANGVLERDKLPADRATATTLLAREDNSADQQTKLGYDAACYENCAMRTGATMLKHTPSGPFASTILIGLAPFK